MRELPLTTKRLVLAQLFICQGCCCGRVDKGNPEVPAAWLKAEFKARKLIRNVQVTISGCLGPCDVPNVVAILMAGGGLRWFGRIDQTWQYESLLDWASEVKARQRIVELPAWLERHELDPLRAEAVEAAAVA